jgi:hypothetical protein
MSRYGLTVGFELEEGVAGGHVLLVLDEDRLDAGRVGQAVRRRSAGG